MRVPRAGALAYGQRQMPEAFWLPLMAVSVACLSAGVWATERREKAAAKGDRAILWDVFLLPIVVGIAPVNTLAALVALVPLLCVSAHRLSHRRWNLALPLPFVLMLLASVPVLLRSDATLLWLGGGVILVALFIAMADFIPTRQVVTSLVDGLGLYLILNVAGYLVGITSSIAALRAISRSVTGGPFGLRVLFPFASNAEAPSIAAALFVVATLGVRGGPRDRRLLRIGGLAAAGFVALGANYRAPMVAGAIVLVMIRLAPKALTLATGVVAVAALTLPFTYSSVRHVSDPAIGAVVSVVPYLERVEERGSTGSLTGRDRVWVQAVRYWQLRTPMVEKAIGWGNNGQVKSGASSSYAPLLRGAVRDPTNATVHNSGLQQVFDAGLFGFMALLGAILLALRRWRSLGDPGLVSIALVMTICIVAATDVGLVPGRVDVSFIVLAVLLGAMRRPEAEDVHDARLNSATRAATALDATMLGARATPRA